MTSSAATSSGLPEMRPRQDTRTMRSIVISNFRMLEIPTLRSTAYDANYYKLKDLAPEITLFIHERAYTSPIWHSP